MSDGIDSNELKNLGYLLRRLTLNF
ncbi:MAG: hypothetical protein RLY69_902, partial [Verrucomicrobiota bacterium]